MFRPIWLFRDLFDYLWDNLSSRLGIREQMLDDRLCCYRFIVNLPAIVVCYQTDCGKSDLCFAGKLCFRQVRHATHVETHFSVEVGLRPSRKSRPIHIYISSTIMNSTTDGPGGVGGNSPQLWAHRIRKRNVGDDAFAKKCPQGSLAGSIKELGRQ